VTREEVFKAAVKVLVDAGVHPSGPRIRRELGRAEMSGMLNGEETRWRRELLTSLGWTRGEGLSARWRRP
jgi:hypothetical protein